VQGDRHTWRLALAGAGGGATGSAVEDEVPEWLEGEYSCQSAAAVEFVARAPATGPTGVAASRDAGARLLANRDALVADAARRALGILDKNASRSHAVTDATLRVAAHLLLAAAGLEEGEGEVDTVGKGVDVRGFVEAAVGEGGGKGKGDMAEALAQVRAVCLHTGSRICTPRDMGALPALRLRQAKFLKSQSL
jgi:hypothetical protein